MGNGGVGKSATVIRFIQNAFVAEYDPTIEDSYRKAINVGGKDVLVDILDTAGVDEWGVMRDAFMRDGEVFVLMFSVTDRSSLEDLSSYRERIFRLKEVERVPMVVVANKVDVGEDERKVFEGEGENLASSWGVPFIQCSAKTGQNVTEVFTSAVLEVFNAATTPRQLGRRSACVVC